MSGLADEVDAALLSPLLRSALHRDTPIADHRFLIQAKDYAVIAMTLSESRRD